MLLELALQKSSSAGNDAQAGTSGSAASESNKSSQATAILKVSSCSSFSWNLDWYKSSATDISFTVDADGNITSKANFNVDYEPYRQSSTTAKLFKFLVISTFGRVAIFQPCFLVLQD
ncbi:MAG: hypothetical protein ACLS5G_00560 [Streptococcus sp.]